MSQSTSNLIQSRLNQTRVGNYALSDAFSMSDFADLGSSVAVMQALSRLARCGSIRRICKGIYDIPKISSLSGNPLPASIEAVAQTIARRTGATITLSGARAANRLGLSAQVPAQSIYLTSGRTRTLSIGNRTLTLKRTQPSKLNFSGVTGEIVSALRYLGKGHANSKEIIAILSPRLTIADKQALLSNISAIPQWMRPIIRHITKSTHPYATVS